MFALKKRISLATTCTSVHSTANHCTTGETTHTCASHATRTTSHGELQPRPKHDSYG